MPNRLIHLIVIHCSATPSGKPLQQGKLNAPQVINAWHAARGFHRDNEARRNYNPQLPSIGYHYVIDLNGDVWTGRGLDEVGAHAVGHNIQSVGVCLVGGQERDAKYTPAQWASLAELVRMLSAQCRVPVMFNMTRGVCGHRDLSPDKNGNGVADPVEWLKTCPGFDVKGWIERGLQPLPLNVLQSMEG